MFNFHVTSFMEDNILINFFVIFFNARQCFVHNYLKSGYNDFLQKKQPRCKLSKWRCSKIELIKRFCYYTESIRVWDWNLVKVVRWLFLCHFWPFWSKKYFLRKLGQLKNCLEPKIKPSYQVKLVQIPDTHAVGLCFYWVEIIILMLLLQLTLPKLRQKQVLNNKSRMC